MLGHMEAVAVVAEVVEATLVAVADILAVDTLADTAVTLVAAGGTRVVIIILEVLVIMVVAIMVAGVADGVTVIPVVIGGTWVLLGMGMAVLLSLLLGVAVLFFLRLGRTLFLF